MTDDELDGLAHLVKPLQWWTPSSSNNWTHGAKTLFGTYYVGIDGGRHNAWIEIFREGEGIEQWIGPDRGDLHIAMGDARADYTRRILSALNLDALGSQAPAIKRMACDQCKARNEMCDECFATWRKQRLDALRSPPADVGEAARAAYNAYEEAGMYPECSPRWEDIGSCQEHWKLAVRAALRALAETTKGDDPSTET